MLRLKRREATVWLDVLTGIRVQVPPLSIAILRAAENAGHRAMVDYLRQVGAESSADLTPEQFSDFQGVFAEARVAALGSKIQAWEGVGGDDGVPVDPTPEYIALFVAEPQVATAFVAAYDATALPEISAGNVSAPSGTGEPAEGQNTAEAAKEPAESALA